MNTRPYRSLFWPVVLIGVGLVWLLSNAGLIAPINIGFLFRLWPIVLIVIGLDLLFGRQAPWLSTLIGVLAVLAILGLLVFGPALGINMARGRELTTEQLSVPLDDATSARVTLDLAEAHNSIYTLGASDALVAASIQHYGNVSLTATGTSARTVRLQQTGPGDWFQFGIFERMEWNIGLSSEVPMDLEIDGGSGSSDIELDGLQLTGLTLDIGSGSVNLSLPEGSEAYPVEVIGGSGSFNADLACGTEVRLDGGSGSLTLDLPDGCPARVEVRDSGSGSVSVSNALDQVENGDDDEGVWESEDYAGSEQAVVVIMEDVGSGSITVR